MPTLFWMKESGNLAAIACVARQPVPCEGTSRHQGMVVENQRSGLPPLLLVGLVDGEALLELGRAVDLAGDQQRAIEQERAPSLLDDLEQQPGSPELLRGLTDHPADRGGRSVTIPLCQPQERETRLWLPPAPARLPIHLLGRDELSQQAMKLTLPLEGSAAIELIPHPRAKRSPACRASSSALCHAPPSSMISARCTRHTPVWATMSDCRSHHRANASVHSRARRSSYTLRQNAMCCNSPNL